MKEIPKRLAHDDAVAGDEKVARSRRQQVISGVLALLVKHLSEKPVQADRRGPLFVGGRGQRQRTPLPEFRPSGLRDAEQLGDDRLSRPPENRTVEHH
jgi:hypothetical protein